MIHLHDLMHQLQTSGGTRPRPTGEMTALPDGTPVEKMKPIPVKVALYREGTGDHFATVPAHAWALEGGELLIGCVVPFAPDTMGVPEAAPPAEAPAPGRRPLPQDGKAVWLRMDPNDRAAASDRREFVLPTDVFDRLSGGEYQPAATDDVYPARAYPSAEAATAALRLAEAAPAFDGTYPHPEGKEKVYDATERRHDGKTEREPVIIPNPGFTWKEPAPGIDSGGQP